MRRRQRVGLAALTLSAGLSVCLPVTLAAAAQDQPARPDPVPSRPTTPGGGQLPGQRDLAGALRGARGNIAQARERVNQVMQERLEASDDEWKVLGPRLERLIVLKLDANGGIGTLAAFVRIPPGLAGILRAAGVLDSLGPFADLFDSPVALASENLRNALAEETPRAADIAFHLDQFRRAREQTRLQAEQLEREVRELLTARQEALLVMYNLLE